jgi:hypothetical protein
MAISRISGFDETPEIVAGQEVVEFGRTRHDGVSMIKDIFFGDKIS